MPWKTVREAAPEAGGPTVCNELLIERRVDCGPLSTAERRLIASLAAGTPVDLSIEPGDDPVIDGRPPVRAAVVRQIIRGRAVPLDEIDPHGVQVQGAHLEDTVDLDDVTFPLSLTFTDCRLGAGLRASRAALHRLRFDRSIIDALDEETSLHADQLTTTHNLVLSDCTVAGAVRLPGAHVGGQLGCLRPGKVSGGALVLKGASVAREMCLDRSFRSIQAPKRWLALDGLTYRGLPKREELDAWLTMLADETTEYAAQPWQHLAAAHRAVGHDRDAIRVLIAQQDDRRERVVHPRCEDHDFRVWPPRIRGWARYFGSHALKALTGYGYRWPRTLLWLLGLMVVSVGLGLWAGNVDAAHVNGPAVAAPGKPHAGNACSTVDLVGLGVDWALPIVSTGASDRCALDPGSGAGG
jgi:hypothetical protein